MIRIKGNLKKLADQDKDNELKGIVKGNIKVKDEGKNENILLGKYRLEKILNHGYTKEEYLTTDIEENTLCVIRYIQSDTDSYIGVELMEDEECLKNLSHVGLPKIKEMYNDDRSVYIVQNYTEGVTLEDVLKSKEFISEKELIKIAKQLCEVFEYLHNCKPHPIIYRYIKPSDIVITQDNRVVIVGFGVYEKITGVTEKFAAPEFVKSGYSDSRTDIYSLGRIFYNLLTGTEFTSMQNAFKNSINKHISRNIKKILLKCLEENLSDRYQDIREIKTKFELLETKKYKNKKIKMISIFVLILIVFIVFMIIYR